ncbi:MAG: hypothetical protein JRJ78_04540 [Deltaproteobacteria bacterium]|nr:hypothetical protein [Deltaproteobacteria bacterium]
MIKDFIKHSPLKILEKSVQKGLGRGNLGVLLARAGVGKTACLIHIALDRIFQGNRLVHISLEDVPEKITSYYGVIFNELVKALEMEDEQDLRMILERNRMILAYVNRSFDLLRLRAGLDNLVDKIDFPPDTLIVDGLDFPSTGREVFEGFKALAEDYGVEVWFSALSHRHIGHVNERGVPYPCNHLDDLFHIILHLEPTPMGLFLNLLKDHEGPVRKQSRIRLDPSTFLSMEE